MSGRVAMIPPDKTWEFLWGRLWPSGRGLILMVKWRAWGIGVEFWQDYGFALFLGPLCLALGGTTPQATDSGVDLDPPMKRI